MKAALCLAMVAAVSAVDESIFDYSKRSYRVGQWVPPAPPSHESSGLKGKVPIPSEFDLASAASDFKFAGKGTNNVAFKSGARKLLMAGGEAVKGSKVPHNWFGQGKYQAPTYDIATGAEECDVCENMIKANMATVTLPEGEAGEVAEAGMPKPLCGNMDPKFKDMCKGYTKYLQDCPSFVHNICHQDMGGSERLRAPCPSYLVCYYCLRINPLYCLDED